MKKLLKWKDIEEILSKMTPNEKKKFVVMYDAGASEYVGFHGVEVGTNTYLRPSYYTMKQQIDSNGQQIK